MQFSAVADVCWYLLELFDGVLGRREKSRVLFLAKTLRIFPAY